MSKLIEYIPSDPITFGPRVIEDREVVETTVPSTEEIDLTTSSPSRSYAERLNNYRKLNYRNPHQDTVQPTQPTQTSPLSGTITGSAEFERVWDEYLQENPQDAEWRDFLTKIAKKESAFQNVQNKANAPAYGFYQLWETNLRGHTPEEVLNDPKLQIKLAIQLGKENLRNFKPEDFKKAEELGYNETAMRWGAWLGGVGGVRDYLHSNIDRSDSHHYNGRGGSTVGTYMKMGNYKEGGSLKNINLIEIEDKEFYINVVESEEEKTIGLSDKKSLPKNEGMLFIIKDDEKDNKGLIWFTMEDTKFPLDIIFINEDLEVTQISKGEPMSKEPIYGMGDYVLELNIDSGVKVGDDVEFVSDKQVNKQMIVLDPEGNPQMKLDGGERIMSINNTKTLIKFAKKASVTSKDNDYKALGKRVFKFLETQNSADPEYV